MKKEDSILIGKIVNVHGLTGTLKVYSYAESVDIFKTANPVLALAAGKNGTKKTYRITRANKHGKFILVSFEGINDCTEAEKFKGCDLFVSKNALPKLEKNEYYQFDIIGIDVFTINESYLGKITQIIPTGSNDVYVVKNDSVETLIPALDWIICGIDIKENRMRVDLPEEL